MFETLRTWTITRWIYAGLGSYLVVVSIMERNWVAALFGTYFAAMGIFGFGCAVGNCAAPSQSNNRVQDIDSLEVEYQEIKHKNHGNNNKTN